MKTERIEVTRLLLDTLFPDVEFSEFEIRRLAQLLTDEVIKELLA